MVTVKTAVEAASTRTSLDMPLAPTAGRPTGPGGDPVLQRRRHRQSGGRADGDPVPARRVSSSGLTERGFPGFFRRSPHDARSGLVRVQVMRRPREEGTRDALPHPGTLHGDTPFGADRAEIQEARATPVGCPVVAKIACRAKTTGLIVQLWRLEQHAEHALVPAPAGLRPGVGAHRGGGPGGRAARGPELRRIFLGSRAPSTAARHPGAGRVARRDAQRRHSSISEATRAVQPVWWEAPSPCPVSPWKYS